MASVFIKIVNMSITASWLILAVMLLRALFRKSPRWMMVILWGLVGLRLILPVSVESENGAGEEENGTIGNGDEATGNADESGTNLKSADGLRAAMSGALSAAADVLAAGWSAMVDFLQIHSGILSVIWLFGAIAVLSYMAVNCIFLRVRLKTAVLLEESENIYQSEFIDSPFLLGLLRPRIYLPFTLKEEDMPCWRPQSGWLRRWTW